MSQTFWHDRAMIFFAIEQPQQLRMGRGNLIWEKMTGQGLFGQGKNEWLIIIKSYKEWGIE